MDTDNFLKNKWSWITGGIILLVIIIVVAGGSEKKSIPETSQSQISSEQQVEILIPIKQLINKTPAEIEAITGQKIEVYGKKPSGKLMEAGFKVNGIDVWTVYSLIAYEKVKYNGTILFQISFGNYLPENEAWKLIDFIPPHKSKAIVNSSRRVVWESIPEILPFNKVDVWYINDKVETLKVYLLSEDEETSLYEL